MNNYPFVSCKIIADSLNPFNEIRLTTMEVTLPRYVHAELLTHRVFSRNASSSRATPVSVLLDRVQNDPVLPIEWGLNQRGMQAREVASPEIEDKARSIWLQAAANAAESAKQLDVLGIHKQLVNRLIENFTIIKVLITSTQWENYFTLRNHPDAQPEIRALAEIMQEAYNKHLPNTLEAFVNYDHMSSKENNWHLPYILEEERVSFELEDLLKLSTARCARVSYLNFDDKPPAADKDRVLFDKLVGSEPLHASPIEHCALCVNSLAWFNNFHGWGQYRWFYERELNLE
jgi:thymidylate synthase ThyX